MKTFEVKATVKSSGYIDVKANTIEEALVVAERMWDEGVPFEFDQLQQSFSADVEFEVI